MDGALRRDAESSSSSSAPPPPPSGPSKAKVRPPSHAVAETTAPSPASLLSILAPCCRPTPVPGRPSNRAAARSLAPSSLCLAILRPLSPDQAPGSGPWGRIPGWKGGDPAMEGGSNRGEDEPAAAPNPFVHEPRLSRRQQVQFYVLGVILAPIRVALAFVVLFLIWPFALLQVVGLPEETLQEPCSGWRNTVSHGSVYWLSRLMFFLLGFMRIRVRGQRASRLEAPILVAAPHSTFFDPIILLPCDLPKVVSRTENLDVPVIGALLRFNQAILVSRHDPASRKKVVEEVKKRATSQGKWPQVLFYPEGTCSNKKALLKFKPGAFISGVPIQPVLIRYPNSVDSTTWAWRGPGVLKVIWLTASQPCTTVEVEFLPVYQPSPEEAVNPTLYANNVQKVMAKALGIPATDCEFVGNLPVTVVGRLRVALEPRIWELGKAIRKARYPAEGIKYNLDVLPVGTSGQVGPNELAHWLGLACPKAVEEICVYFQQDSNGNMDAREVALALEALQGEHDPQQLTRRAFELFSEVEAKTGTSCLHQDGFCAILRLLLGTPVVDGTELYGRLCTEDHSRDGLNLGQFQDFSLHHPDYARLFSTYLRPPPACALPKPAQASTYTNGVSAIPPKSKSD